MKSFSIYTRLAVSLLLLAFSFSLPGQAARDLNWYAREAASAISKENFEYAIKTLKEGISQFPQSAKLNLALAELYFKKKLYEIALAEYLQADAKDPDNYTTMDQIQRCYGYMNDEDKAIAVLKRMLEKYPLDTNPGSYKIVDDLGWMYYKTHRLEEGEKLILETLADRGKYEINQGLYMTLGTIYSGMYDYERSKEYYLKAIGESESASDVYFSSIAYYNLSLLEHNFYNFNSALKYTDVALANEERATGHLAKGELYQSQMNYARTQEEYNRGLNLDETPLTMINMAVSARVFGRLDTSLAYAQKVLDTKDQSWMVNFGTDTDRHKAELFRIIANTFDGLAKREALLPSENIIGACSSLLNGAYYGVSSYYYRQRYKAFAIRIGKEYLAEKNLLDAYRQFYNANEDYTDVALKYLVKAGEIELNLIPASKAMYLQEQGMQERSKEKILESITMFDPFWEKESIAESLTYLAGLAGPRTREGRDYLSRIYDINPGGLIQYGYGLPMEVRFDLAGKMKIMAHLIPKLLEDSGSEIMLENRTTNQEIGFRYLLKIEWHEGEDPSFALVNSEKEVIVKQGSVELGRGNPHAMASAFINTLLKEHIYVAGN